MRPLIAAVVLCLGCTARAQSDTAAPPVLQHDVSVNLIVPVAGLVISGLVAQDVLAFSAEFEQRLGVAWTGYIAPGVTVGTLFGEPLLGGTLSLGTRFYPMAGAPAGVWLGPELAGTLSSGLAARAWTLSLSGFAGYNFVFLKQVLLSVGAGVGVRTGTLGLGLTPALRVNLGYIF